MQSSRTLSIIDAAIWIGVFFLGFGIGILSATKLKVDWFEATGTWIGGIGTFVAVVLAASAFRAERREHRSEMDNALKTINAERAAVNQAARNEASLVYLTAGGAGRQIAPGLDRYTSATYTVANSSSRPIRDVEVWHPIHCPTVKIADLIQPGATQGCSIELANPIESPPSSIEHLLLESGATSFVMDGLRWYKGPFSDDAATTEEPDGWSTTWGET